MVYRSVGHIIMPPYATMVIGHDGGGRHAPNLQHANNDANNGAIPEPPGIQFTLTSALL